jgi:hypothetical protein
MYIYTIATKVLGVCLFVCISLIAAHIKVSRMLKFGKSTRKEHEQKGVEETPFEVLEVCLPKQCISPCMFEGRPRI